MFLSVEGAGHWWISRTLWAILTICDWEVALIAFHFLWSLRRLRDSIALDTQILGFLNLVIIFSTLIHQRWTLLIAAYLREIAECLVPAIGAFDKYCLIFRRPRVVWAILTSVFQYTECIPVTLRTLGSMLVIAFEASILFTIVLWEPTLRALIHFPHLFRVQLLLKPSIFHMLIALLILIYGRLISFVLSACWILLCTYVSHCAMRRVVGIGGRLLLLEGVLLSLVPLVVVLFEFGLLDNIFVPDLHEHHVNGFVSYPAFRTFVAWDILEVQSVNLMTMVALPTFAPLKLHLLLLLFFVTFALSSCWRLCQLLILLRHLH